MKRTAMKNTLFIISVVTLCIALALCVLGIMLLPFRIVYAADVSTKQNVICAPVSNLESNAYAGASSLTIITSEEVAFCIPESYYVSDVHHSVANYYGVSYCGFDDKFFIKSDTAPTTSTVTLSSDVSLYPDTILALKADATLTLEGTPVTAEHTIRLLGYSPTDATQIFVCATLNGESKLGFADSASLESFVVEYHPVAQAEREQLLARKYQPDPDNGDIAPNTSLALRIVLIIGICVPALIIAILLFKPSKNDRSQSKSVIRKGRSKNDFDYDSSRTYSPDRSQNGYDDARDRTSRERDNYDNNDYNRSTDNRDWRR